MSTDFDTYGGWPKVKGTRTGWFHLEEIEGRNWFITPEGNGFYPVSMAHMFTENSRLTVERAYHGDQSAWMEDWFSKIRDLGFNSALAGVTSQCRNVKSYVDVDLAESIFERERFPYSVGIFLIPHPNELPEGQERPDIFSAEYKAWARELIVKTVTKYKDNPLVMGYYYGFGSFMNARPWVEKLGRKVDDESLQSHIREMACSLYQFAHEEIRKIDQNHLIFGPFVKEQSFDLETWKQLSPYLDTIAPQHINRAIDFEEQADSTGLPILVSDETTNHLYTPDKKGAHILKSAEGKARIWEAVMERHLSDTNICGVNFCTTLNDLDDGPLLEWYGMLEGIYENDGSPREVIVEALKEATSGIYEKAITPVSKERLSKQTRDYFKTWDSYHGVF